MSRIAARSWLSIALCIGAPAVWATPAQQLLQTELSKAYPSVQRWEIAAIGVREAAPGDAEALIVARLGARSLVTQGARRYWFKVAGFGAVPVAQRAIAGGETLSRGDLAMEERDVVALGCASQVDAASVVGRVAGRPLTRGTAICGQSVAAAHAVSAGKAVTAHFYTGNVAIATAATASDSGDVGQRVRVRLATRRIAMATVVGSAEVRIDE